MINIYDSLHDGLGNTIEGRTKLFIINTRENNLIGEYLSGIACVPEKPGTMFIIDDYALAQVDKLVFKDGVLSVRDGEELIPPVKSDAEIEREELLKQIAELDKQIAEPAE